jgi:hypothetical protein
MPDLLTVTALYDDCFLLAPLTVDGVLSAGFDLPPDDFQARLCCRRC